MTPNVESLYQNQIKKFRVRGLVIWMEALTEWINDGECPEYTHDTASVRALRQNMDELVHDTVKDTAKDITRVLAGLGTN